MVLSDGEIPGKGTAWSQQTPNVRIWRLKCCADVLVSAYFHSIAVEVAIMSLFIPFHSIIIIYRDAWSSWIWRPSQVDVHFFSLHSYIIYICNRMSFYLCVIQWRFSCALNSVLFRMQQVSPRSNSKQYSLKLLVVHRSHLLSHSVGE